MVENTQPGDEGETMALASFEVESYDPHEVYECWVGDQKDTFEKLHSLVAARDWAARAILSNGVGAHIHIVIHSSNEYS